MIFIKSKIEIFVAVILKINITLKNETYQISTFRRFRIDDNSIF